MDVQARLLLFISDSASCGLTVEKNLQIPTQVLSFDFYKCLICHPTAASDGSFCVAVVFIVSVGIFR